MSALPIPSLKGAALSVSLSLLFLCCYNAA